MKTKKKQKKRQQKKKETLCTYSCTALHNVPCVRQARMRAQYLLACGTRRMLILVSKKPPRTRTNTTLRACIRSLAPVLSVMLVEQDVTIRAVAATFTARGRGTTDIACMSELCCCIIDLLEYEDPPGGQTARYFVTANIRLLIMVNGYMGCVFQRPTNLHDILLEGHEILRL